MQDSPARTPEPTRSRVLRERAGTTYALALIWRGHPGDEQLALKVLREAAPGIGSRPERWILRGLQQLVLKRAAATWREMRPPSRP